MGKLNVVFPVGKKPEIVFSESPFADKDCYIYWDHDYLKLNPSWLPKDDVKHKEVYAVNRMQSSLKRKDKIIELLECAVEFYADRDNWKCLSDVCPQNIIIDGDLFSYRKEYPHLKSGGSKAIRALEKVKELRDE